MIPGGGIGDGPIRGALNVFVIDEDTRNVLSSAAVRVGAAEETEPCQALTDSTGLARFDSSASGSSGTADGGAGASGCKLLDQGRHADGVRDGPRAQHLDRRRRQQRDDRAARDLGAARCLARP